MKIYIAGRPDLPIKELIENGNASEQTLRRFGLEPVSSTGVLINPALSEAEKTGCQVTALLECEALYLPMGWQNITPCVILNAIAESLGFAVCRESTTPGEIVKSGVKGHE